MPSFSVRKPFTVLVMVVIIFALGITSFQNMKPELLPNIELPYVITLTTYPGATSEKVEEEVTRPLEQGFATLEGLKSVSSQSRANFSMVMLEFADGVNLDSVTIDMLQRISQAEGSWDDMVSTPIIIKMNPDMLPVMVAAVEMDGAGTAELSALVEDELQLKLEGIDGVASVSVTGLRREQVNVVIRAEKVKQVNERIAESVRREIGDKEDELVDKKADLQAKLNDLKKKNTELEDGIKEFAEKMGEGSIELGDNWAKWAAALAELDSQLALLQGQLATLQQQKAVVTAQAIEDAIAAAMEAALAAAIEEAEKQMADELGLPYPLPEGVSLPDAVVEAITAGVMAYFTDEVKAEIAAEVTKMVDEEFKKPEKQLKDGIKKLKDGIEQIKAGGEALAQAEGMIASMTIETQFTLTSAAAQIAAAQGQLNAGIAQIEQGLDQFEDALDTALKKADMSGVLTVSMVMSLLKAQNFEMPAGTVKQGYTEYLVRVGDKVASANELEKMALIDTGMDDVGVIVLSDVADVFVSDNLSDVYAKINGNDGILLQFSKQSERSTTEVADTIMAKFKEIEAMYPGLRFTPLMNQGDYIYRVINSITSDLLWGALFAILILLLFLRDIRPTFITLCSIPISLVFALTAMYFAGVTINIISLSGLAIAVGRLVDDSVVVMENIFRLRMKGYSAARAAITGASQVAGAVTASTLTTICVFLPLVFVQGMTRQIFKDFGLTFAFALLASLLIAMTLVPALSSGMFHNMQPKQHRWLDRFIAGYDKALVWSLRFKPVVLIFAVVMLVASVSVVWTKGFAYMPEGASNQISVSITMPKESTVEQRKERADEAAARIGKVEGVKTVGMMVGTGSGFGTIGALIGGGRSGSSDMRYIISYALFDEGAGAEQVSAGIKDALQGLDMEVSVENGSMMSMSMLSGSGISIDIYSDDTGVLMQSAKAVSEAVAALEGVAEVDDGMEDVTSELHFTVDRKKAAEHGLTTAQVFQQVNTALTKESSATQVTWRGDTFNVMVGNEHAQAGELTPAFIKGLAFFVTKRDGTTEEVRLADVASVSEGQALPTVLRSEQRRYLPVSVTIGDGYNVTLVTQDVERALASLRLPSGVTYEVTGETATIMDAFEQLAIMLLLGLLLVYLIMVAQFQSLKSPFVIMFTVPLAFTGGFLALYVTGQILSVVSLIGFAMLVGVIVANAIVLVDYINRLRLDGKERVEAIREGAATRMRPILMTALATIGALVMMALGIGNGSEMMRPLAIVCIGGLAYGTLMTLFVIPVIYDAFSKKELRKIDAADLVIDRDA